MKRTHYHFFVFLIYLGIFTIFRFLFYVKYNYRLETEDTKLLIQSFFIGLRFDIATIGMLLGIFWILSSIHYLNRFFYYVFIWSYLPFLLLAWVIGHLTGDLIYFENANKHIGYEAFVFIGKDLLFIIYNFLINDPLGFSLVIILLVLFILSTIYLYSRYFKWDYKKETYLITIRNTLLVICLSIIIIRGGIQESPIRASDSLFSDDTFLNNLALNGVFTSIMDMKSQKIPPSHKMDLTQAILIARKEIEYNRAKWVELPNYPLLRKTIETNPGKLPNIVLILLESWTGKFVYPNSNGIIYEKEVTPYFNQLARKSRVYPRFFSTGGRTTNGLISVLTGMPDRPGLTAFRTHQILSNFSTLGNLAKKLGYKTYFINGDDLSFDNVGSVMPRWGFEIVIGKKELQMTGKYKMGGWGFDDRDIYHAFEEELKKLPKEQPFFGVILTMTTHYPYIVPDKKFEIYSPNLQDYDYLNTLHYADWALHDFLNSFEKFFGFENTIFVLVGDHTHHRFLNYYEDRNIPFLIYSPKFIQPSIDNRIAGQIDILPTILGLIGKEIYFTSLGKDLLDPSNQNSSTYFAYGNAFGWIEDNLFYFQFADGPASLAFTVNPPHKDNPICELNPLICENHKLKSKAFLNLSIELLNRDSIFPKEAYFFPLK